MTKPGVYIQEVPLGASPITGVATSVAAFIGYFSRGPMHKPIRILTVGDFKREFGDFVSTSLAGYAIAQFFQNGGKEAWVVRTAGTTAAQSPQRAAITIKDSSGKPVFQVSAASEGVWGNNLRIDVDYATRTPAAFNLAVSEVVNGAVQAREFFRNLTVVEGEKNNAVDVVNSQSKLIVLKSSGQSVNKPAPTGTTSKPITSLKSVTAKGKIRVAIGSSGARSVSLATTPRTLKTLAAALQKTMRSAGPAYSRIVVTAKGTLASRGFLQVKAGNDDPSSVTVLSGPVATTLGLSGRNQQNVQQYSLGGTEAGRQSGGVLGKDGAVPSSQDLIGALHACEAVDLVNILCLPDTDQLADAAAAEVIAAASNYAAKRRAFYVVDLPNLETVRLAVTDVKAWLQSNKGLRHPNAAAYFPRPVINDRLSGGQPRAIPASGTIAGIFARVDEQRGVWKAPAGVQAVLQDVQGLETLLTDAENDVLNPAGINCLRFFATSGNVVWGARTLAGADELASDWKYIPVRRLALFVEESVFRGTGFATFEPNDEPLWAQLRLVVGTFMQNLFRQGALMGQTPREAYFVKCDRDTTTQNDIDQGIVNIDVGFAPLKPAEFVVLHISQMARRPPD